MAQTVEAALVAANEIAARMALYAAHARFAREDGDVVRFRHWARRAQVWDRKLDAARVAIDDARRDETLRIERSSATHPREPGCLCHREEGDSPCPVHVEPDDVATPVAPVVRREMTARDEARLRALIAQSRLIVAEG